MRYTNVHTRILAGVSSTLFLAAGLFAQTGAAPATTPAATTESVQSLIKATDEEWKVISPKLQAVSTARQAVTTYTATNAGRGGFGGPNFGTDSFAGPGNGMGGGRGGRGGGPPGGFGGGPGGQGGPGGPGGQDFGGGGRGGRGGGGGQGMPFGGPGGGGGNNAVSAALAELKTALADTSSTPEQIKAKVDVVRSARQKAAADLVAAQKSLLPLLTADQEAMLVSLGYID